MLVSVDCEYHNLIKYKLSKVTEIAQIYFSRMNEIEISPINGEQIGDSGMFDLEIGISSFE